MMNCGEPGCSYGTQDKSNMKKHMVRKHQISDPLETPWFREQYKDLRTRTAQEKAASAARKKSSNADSKRKSRLLKKIKDQFPLHEEIEVIETVEELVPGSGRHDPDPMFWPNEDLEKAFGKLLGLMVYQKRDLATLCFSAVGVRQWASIWHPDKIGQRYIGLGLGSTTDPAYVQAMEDFPNTVLKPSKSNLVEWQRWFKRKIEDGSFDEWSEPEPITVTRTVVTRQRRWENEEAWWAFIKQEFAARSTPSNQQSSSRQIDSEDSDEDF
jgi:hypothetical protein